MIKRKLVTYIVFLLLGLAALSSLNYQLFPTFHNNVAYVLVTVPDEDPNNIYTQYGIPFLSETDNYHFITHIDTKLYDSTLQFNVYFAEGTDLKEGHEKLNEAIARLPPMPTFAPPVELTSFYANPVTKLASFSVLDLSLDNQRSEHDLINLIEDKLLSPIESIPGIRVIEQQPFNNRTNILLSYEKLLVYEITPKDVYDVLINQRDMKVRVLSDHSSPDITIKSDQSIESVLNTYIKTVGNRPIYLSELATIKPDRSIINNYEVVNNYPSRSYSVFIAQNYDSLDAYQDLYDKLEGLNKEFSKYNLEVVVGQDGAYNLKGAISSLLAAVVIGLFLTILVFIAFRLNKQTIIFLMGMIPFCVSFTSIIMWLLNVSVNVFTLASIVFSIGVALDTAIIWVFRKSSKESSRLLNALLVATLTTIVSVLPFIVFKASSHIAINNMATVFAAMVIGSFIYIYYFRSLSIYAEKNRAIKVLIKNYIKKINVGNYISWFMITVIIFTAAVVFYTSNNNPFAPATLQSGAVIYYVNQPSDINEGTYESHTLKLDKAIKAYSDDHPGNITHSLSFANTVNGMGVKVYSRDDTALEHIEHRLPKYIADTGYSIYKKSYAYYPQPTNIGEAEFYYALDDGFAEISDLRRLKNKLLLNPLIANVEIEPDEGSIKEVYELTINPDSLVRYGLTEQAIKDHINAYFNGLYLETRNDGPVKYHLFISTDIGHSIEDIYTSTIPVNGSPVLLSNFLDTQYKEKYSLEYLFDGKSVIKVRAILADGISVSDFLEYWDDNGKDDLLQLSNFSENIYLSPLTNQYQKAEQSLHYFVFASLALVIVVVIQYFSSILRSLIAMVSVLVSMASAIIVAMVSSLYFGKEFNSITITTILMVIGISMNTAILLMPPNQSVSFDNVLKQLNTRAYPLLLTLLTTIATSLPLLIVPSKLLEAYFTPVIIVCAGTLLSLIVSVMIILSLVRVIEK